MKWQLSFGGELCSSWWTQQAFGYICNQLKSSALKCKHSRVNVIRSDQSDSQILMQHTKYDYKANIY